MAAREPRARRGSRRARRRRRRSGSPRGARAASRATRARSRRRRAGRRRSRGRRRRASRSGTAQAHSSASAPPLAPAIDWPLRGERGDELAADRAEQRTAPARRARRAGARAASRRSRSRAASRTGRRRPRSGSRRWPSRVGERRSQQVRPLRGRCERLSRDARLSCGPISRRRESRSRRRQVATMIAAGRVGAAVGADPGDLAGTQAPERRRRHAPRARARAAAPLVELGRPLLQPRAAVGALGHVGADLGAAVGVLADDEQIGPRHRALILGTCVAPPNHRSRQRPLPWGR